MKRQLIIVLLAMVLFASLALAQAQEKPPEALPGVVDSQVTDQQIQNAIQDLSGQLSGQVAIRNKAVKDIQDASNNIDRLIAQIQQLQGELKKRQDGQKPKGATPPVKK